MRIAMLSTIAWRTPPRHYGPWESIVSLITEGLVARGYDVTLFATGDSITSARLRAVCPIGYEENSSMNSKVWESLHISELFDHADEFDIIHNHFDFLPLTYTGMIDTPVITTIHGFSSPDILPVYKKYNGQVAYVSISDADRSPELEYLKTIYHGIDLQQFNFQPSPDDYLLFFGRIHPDKGAKEAIEIAKACNKSLILAGIIQDKEYYEQYIQPHLDDNKVTFVGSVGGIQRSVLLGKASALLHPINFDEPFGLSVIESMACGTPVVAFNRGSMPELIKHGKNGYLVTGSEEAIDYIERIQAIERAECRRTVEERFSLDRMVNQYCDVYSTILEKVT